jgi:hypothetical protein
MSWRMALKLHLRCVFGEDEVASFGGLVAGKAGFQGRRLVRFAVFELSESPAAAQGVFLGVFDHQLDICGRSGDEGLIAAEDLVVSSDGV